MECSRCKAQNPEGNKYCGDCGAVLATLEPNIRQYIDSTITERIKDQHVVEVEVTQRIADRLVGWARILGFFIGIPILIMLAILGFFGIKNYSDVSGKLDETEVLTTTIQKNVATWAAEVEATQVPMATRVAEIGDNMATTVAEVDQRAKQLDTTLTIVNDQTKDLQKQADTLKIQLVDISEVSKGLAVQVESIQRIAPQDISPVSAPDPSFVLVCDQQLSFSEEGVSDKRELESSGLYRYYCFDGEDGYAAGIVVQREVGCGGLLGVQLYDSKGIELGRVLTYCTTTMEPQRVNNDTYAIKVSSSANGPAGFTIRLAKHPIQ